MTERPQTGAVIRIHPADNVVIARRQLLGGTELPEEGVRRELTACLGDVTPPFSLRVTSGIFLDRYRADPEVARLLDAWFSGDDPAVPT